MNKSFSRNLSVLIFMLSCSLASAQSICVKDTVMRTYPFSDPDPVPTTSGIYPYHHFGTFALQPVDQKWKMVVLENDWLRVKIMPEIGGKIWSIYDKTHKKELFYDNDVVKFREISLRGPWTSGGIEFNYGVIGHAPSCAHPVDYKTEYKPDGSVSCYIGVSELLTRTRWTVEINLPKDAVWVKTRSFWHNGSGTIQPYYSWANSGVGITDDTRLIFPGDRYIGHDGQAHNYPVDEEGRDLSLYSNQAFGVDKSFHIVGSHKNFFGTYWTSEDCGMLHYALRDEKVGRKYFSWAQSDQGNIWVDLLTDNRPQYIELQSGRLFNQNQRNSVRTPFKQILFNPYSTDEWSEYWLPFGGMEKVDELTLKAAVNVKEENHTMELQLFALQRLEGKLSFIDKDGQLCAEADLKTSPAENFNMKLDKPASGLDRITLDGYPLWSADQQDIDRPDTINEEFDLNSPEGQIAHAGYLIGMRLYEDAAVLVDKALEQNSSLISGLNLKTCLCLRSMQYEEALSYAGKVLAIDTYNSWGNYLGGLAAMKLGRTYEAMDRFEIAAISPELRSASCTCLARLHFREGNDDLAASYAHKSLVTNAYNVSAYQILQQISPSDEILSQIDELDPLQHFTDMERMLSGKISPEELQASIQEEMKSQNYFEAASFYLGLGLKDKALRIIDADPQQTVLTALWSAWIKGDEAAIADSEKKTVDFVFPFREEDVAILEWAVENGGGWKSHYLLAMTVDAFGNKARALELMQKNDCNYAPYYSYRASLNGNEADLAKAAELNPDQWRYVRNLALYHYNARHYEQALALLEPYFKKHQENFHIGDAYVKTLIAAEKYGKAEKVLAHLTILPFEGQTGSHAMYRDIKLHLAANLIDRGKYKAALEKLEESKEWPWSLGVGKPYEDLVDNVMEDWLAAIAYSRMGEKEKAALSLEKLESADKNENLLDQYRILTRKDKKGKYPEVEPTLGNIDASYDKKLF